MKVNGLLSIDRRQERKPTSSCLIIPSRLWKNTVDCVKTAGCFQYPTTKVVWIRSKDWARNAGAAAIAERTACTVRQAPSTPRRKGPRHTGAFVENADSVLVHVTSGVAAARGMISATHRPFVVPVTHGPPPRSCTVLRIAALVPAIVCNGLPPMAKHRKSSEKSRIPRIAAARSSANPLTRHANATDSSRESASS